MNRYLFKSLGHMLYRVVDELNRSGSGDELKLQTKRGHPLPLESKAQRRNRIIKTITKNQ